MIVHFTLSSIELSWMLTFSASHRHHLPPTLMLSTVVASTYVRMIWLTTVFLLLYTDMLCGNFTKNLPLQCQTSRKRRVLDYIFKNCVQLMEQTDSRYYDLNIKFWTSNILTILWEIATWMMSDFSKRRQKWLHDRRNWTSSCLFMWKPMTSYWLSPRCWAIDFLTLIDTTS